MGASHTTLASTSGGEEGSPELEGDLGSYYAMEQHLFPGSGRMMRTVRLRHKQNASTLVLKSMFVTKQHESIMLQQEQELTKIKEALQGQTHIAPFLYWTVGTYRPKAPSMMVRQVSLVRPHMYTTLSDRLASRPFLTHVEKLWIVYQLLQALEAMHSKQIVHGFLTTENIGLSSWNWVVLVDVASYKARTALPDDDPSEYLYYFQELYQHSTGNGTDNSTITPREKRCYLAPERFYTPNPLEREQHEREQPPLTPAMDIFSAGCVIMETFLNGERALDLGDLMEYRKQKSCQTLQQKLNKIEFSALRAACRHMLHLDASERLSASAYLERLQASELVPESFATLASMMERVTYASPDARLAIAAAHYSSVMWETLGVRDKEGKMYVEKVLGSTMTRLEAKGGNSDKVEANQGNKEDEKEELPLPPSEEKKEESLSNTDIFADTEALLKRLESLTFDEEEVLSVASRDDSSTTIPAKVAPAETTQVKRSQISQSSLLIYLQLILSTVRHVQRPTSKLVALQLMERVGKYSTDEARLQRIVPVTVSLLQDQDPLVRASAIRVLASTVSIIDAFPPSDSKVFPEYIFKRVAHMITDPSLVVRLAFARSVAVLAETSHRFLDISHAVRLYEAVGGGGGGTGSASENSKEMKSMSKNVFTDDVAKLLDESAGPQDRNKKPETSESGVESTSSESVVGTGKTLISSTYNSDLAALQETVSRWVVHITTDQSEHSSPAKRALLGDMARLCNFFGLDGVMAFILPQVLSFLNDRKDWQLRAALFEYLPSVCHIIGRAATEHFVLPCLETALVDGEEPVISRALQCLSELLQMGLLSRSLLLGTPSSSETPPG
jgi:phosphoinositide-3-kinase regulatory subunit 4